MSGRNPSAAIDTNVLVTALLSPTTRSAANQCVTAALDGEFETVASTACFLEYEDVLRRPWLSLDDQLVDAFLDALAELVAWHDPHPATVQLDDVGDQKWVDLLHASKADTLITFNLRHFRKAIDAGYPVMKPAAAIGVLRAQLPTVE